jgi:hypothetical protein
MRICAAGLDASVATQKNYIVTGIQMALGEFQLHTQMGSPVGEKTDD